MKIYLCGVYDGNGVNKISSVEDLDSIANEHRESSSLRDRIAQDDEWRAKWRDHAKTFLTRGYHEFGSEGPNLAMAVWKKFYGWLTDGAKVDKLTPPKVLEFEEPEQQVANLTEQQMLQRVREEFLDNTLLVKTEVSWEKIFDTSEEAPVRQKLASASLLVARRGKTTLYTQNVGALYSGRVATVYASSGGDMQSSAFSITQWSEMAANRKKHADKPFVAINKVLLEGATKGGCSAHNEVLAVLRPKALLGLFYQGPQRKKEASGRKSPTAEETLMYNELCRVQKQYESVMKLPIFRFDYETTKFHLPEAGGGLLSHAKARKA
jgi:hypothetical protein